MKLAVRLPGRGWAELVGFDRLSHERQEKELQEIERIGLEFILVRKDEPFFTNTGAGSD